ncbi:MAG: pseudouridine synthase [Alphaproteobacteria bacterium]|nr:pseudouridine synthase [Alphaproteobacteria bacterium]
MAWTRTYDGAEPQRVNKWLAQSGVCSRREAEALIESGLVRIDGERVNDVGRKIAPGQTLVLTDRAEAQLGAQVSVVIHKPVGLVSAQPEGDQVPAVRLVKADNLFGEAAVIPDARASLAPLGRLDQDSRGLLILSEDGVLAKALIGPESQVDKEYLVTVSGKVTREKILKLRHGLELDGRALKPAKVKQEDVQVLRFTLVEGRNRQIRRMCELVGLEVTDLVRLRIGPVELGDLPEGKWRPLTAGERAGLIAASTAG